MFTKGEIPTFDAIAVPMFNQRSVECIVFFNIIGTKLCTMMSSTSVSHCKLQQQLKRGATVQCYQKIHRGKVVYSLLLLSLVSYE